MARRKRTRLKRDSKGRYLPRKGKRAAAKRRKTTRKRKAKRTRRRRPRSLLKRLFG